ncbi:MAG: hypothetical protein JXR96_21670 [Deltaproteobacteria bacterium]|nr:hypothetical protein [Deltaproteobacteria bacterium]
MRKAALVASAALISACGYGQMQTARTTPMGKFAFTPGLSLVVNENVDERGVCLGNVAPQNGLRYGLSDHVDIGVSQFMFIGLLVDAKVNVLPADLDFALALRGGFGAAYDPWGFMEDTTAWVLHVPIYLIASYTIADRFTPYTSFGYSIFWILGQGIERDPRTTYPEREGYGDGLLRFNGGFEIKIVEMVALLAEYSYWWVVHDDPGDFYSIIDSHVAGVGVKVQFN